VGVTDQEASPDLAAFDEYVVQSPITAAPLFAQTTWVGSHSRPEPGNNRFDTVQQFVYTGERPVSYGGNTLFGWVLYSIKQIAGEDRRHSPRRRPCRMS
jgi:hypothetical protein